MFQVVPFTGPGLAVLTMMCWTSRQEIFGLKLNEQNDTKGKFQTHLGLWENSPEFSFLGFDVFVIIMLLINYLHSTPIGI